MRRRISAGSSRCSASSEAGTSARLARVDGAAQQQALAEPDRVVDRARRRCRSGRAVPRRTPACETTTERAQVSRDDRVADDDDRLGRERPRPCSSSQDAVAAEEVATREPSLESLPRRAVPRRRGAQVHGDGRRGPQRLPSRRCGFGARCPGPRRRSARPRRARPPRPRRCAGRLRRRRMVRRASAAGTTHRPRDDREAAGSRPESSPRRDPCSRWSARPAGRGAPRRFPPSALRTGGRAARGSPAAPRRRCSAGRRSRRCRLPHRGCRQPGSRDCHPARSLWPPGTTPQRFPACRRSIRCRRRSPNESPFAPGGGGGTAR